MIIVDVVVLFFFFGNLVETEYPPPTPHHTDSIKEIKKKHDKKNAKYRLSLLNLDIMIIDQLVKKNWICNKKKITHKQSKGRRKKPEQTTRE